MRLASETFDLPGGYVDSDGEASLLYDQLTVREMTGVEEDMMTDRKKVQSGLVINDLIANCCVLKHSASGKEMKLNSDQVLNMLAGDRMFALIKIREVSHSPLYQFALKCGCGKMNKFEIDLSKLPVTKLQNPMVREHEFAFKDEDAPGGESVILFKNMDGHAEQKMKLLLDQHPGQLFTVNLAARSLKLNGDDTRFFPYLQKLPKRIRNAYMKAAGQIECGLDLSMTKQPIHDCQQCGADFNSDIPLDDPNFFYPASGE